MQNKIWLSTKYVDWTKKIVLPISELEKPKTCKVCKQSVNVEKEPFYKVTLESGKDLRTHIKCLPRLYTKLIL